MLFAVRGYRVFRSGRGLGWHRAAGLGVLLGLAAVPTWSAPPAPQTTPPAQVAPAAQAPAPVFAYTRDVRGADDKVQAVQTAIRRFDPAAGKGPTVYLVAAVHIGETAYYQQLQSFLDKQDVVLFERVKPPRNPKPRPAAADTATGKPTAPPANLQKQLSQVLNLQFQLEAVNYARPNFRNSDMAWDDMETLAAKSGAGTQRSLDELRNTISGGPNAGVAGTMLSSLVKQAADNPAFAKMFRRLLVELVSNPDKLATLRQQQGPDQANLQNILVTERNKVVLTDLKTLTNTPPSSKPVRSVAIFYGAEHMRDMAQHLVTDLHYRPADTQWLTAITVAP